MTGPSGSSREGNASHDEAAGGSPISGVNTVYGARAVLGGTVTSAEPSDAESGSENARSGNTGYGEEILAGAVLAPGTAVTVVKPVLRRRPRARRPRRRFWRTTFFALVLAGLAGIAVWVLFDSRLLVVRSVVVTGTHLVPSSEVIAVAGIERGMPLIRLNTGQVAARIDSIRQVQGVQVTRSWPDKVLITVRERVPALAVTAPGGGFDLVDASGVIVRWSASRPADLPLYPAPAGVASLRGDPDLSAAAAVLGELPAGLMRSVTSVTALSPDQVTLQLSGGITVLWGGTDRAADKARELALLMPTHAHYYDVSSPGTLMTK